MHNAGGELRLLGILGSSHSKNSTKFGLQLVTPLRVSPMRLGFIFHALG